MIFNTFHAMGIHKHHLTSEVKIVYIIELIYVLWHFFILNNEEKETGTKRVKKPQWWCTPVFTLLTLLIYLKFFHDILDQIIDVSTCSHPFPSHTHMRAHTHHYWTWSKNYITSETEISFNHTEYHNIIQIELIDLT